MAATIPTSITQYQTGFAPEIAPYAQNMLGATQGTVFQYKKDEGGQNILDEQGMPIISGFQPYQSYPTQDRFAQFTPLQQRAFSGAENMMPSQTTSGASQLAGMAGLGALGTGYQPLNFQSQSILGNRGGMGGRRSGFGGGRDNFGFGGGQGNLNVGYDSGSQTPRMSGGGNDNGMGGFGGGFGGGMGGGFGGFGMPQNNLGAYMSPYMQNVVGIQQREAQRNADIAGTQQQAQATKAGAFGGGRDAIMRAEAARNLATQKGDIQAKGLQDAYTQAMGQFNQEQQQRQQAAQLGEQSRQYGAGLGLQGLQTALSGANTLGQLGQQQFQQGMDINKLQSQYGGEQQKQMQGMLEADYQDFINRQNYPYKQLGFMSDMLRGAPLSQTGSSVYQQPPSMLGQMTGLATGLGSLFGGKKEGGSVHSYDNGGLTITNPDDSKLEKMMDGMSDGQLQQIIRGSADPDARRIAEEELASRSSISHAMARGGVIVFAKGGDEGEKKDNIYYEDPLGAPSSASGRELSISDFIPDFREKVTEGQKYKPGLQGTLFGYDVQKEEIGGGRGKTPASAYDVKAAVENYDKASRAKTQKDNKGGGAGNASQKIVQGATRIAEQQGVPKETFEDMMDRMMAKFKGANDKDLEGLAKMVAEEKDNAKSIMGDATRQALAKFGFQMAANASQPGAGKGFAGLLKSAASASPTLSESMADSRKLAQAAQDNARRMQIEYTKYKVALDKGDQQLAISTASNLRMMQQQQTQLEETIRHNKASEGLMGQRIAAASAGRGQEKTLAPMLRAIGQANQQAIKATEGYMKTPKGMSDRRPYGEILSEFETRFRKSAVPMFGPTGKVYGNDDDDMEG